MEDKYAVKISITGPFKFGIRNEGNVIMTPY